MKRRRYVGPPLALLAALGCTSPATSPADSEPTSAAHQDAEATEAELVQAHRQALTRVIPLAVQALTADQPVVSGAAGVAPLAGPGWFGTRRTNAQAGIAKVLKEIREIDSGRLKPMDVQVLIGLRFALERARRRVDVPAMSFDPTWITREIGRLLSELEHLQLSSGCSEACAQPLRDAVFGLQGAQRGLKRSSLAALDGALEDLTNLADRVARLQRSVEATSEAGSKAAISITSATTALQAELARARAAWTTRRDGLGDLPEQPWTVLANSRPPTNDFRLPDVIDHKIVHRVLGREEHIEDSSLGLLGSAHRNLARLRAMKSLTSGAEPTTPAPLTLARCAALQTRLQAAITNATPGPLSCEALVAWQAGEKRTDDAALMLMLEHSVILPERRRRWKTQPPHVRLIAGQMAPRAHRWISLIGYAHAASLPGVESLAIDGATRELCQASAALLQHSRVPVRAPRRGEPSAAVEVHTEDTGHVWLSDRCPDIPTENLWGFAARHPWDAMFGGGMVLLNSEPYVMAGLDAFWWTPLGLTISFAIPNPARRSAPQAAAAAPPKEGDITVTVEDL